MSLINLGYGKSSISFEFKEENFSVLGETENQNPLSDAEINEKLDAPIDSKTIEEIIKQGETVLIVVPDATRKSASGQIVNLLVRRLIANGTMPFDISIIFATGIHRAVTEAEKQEILTPFIAQRIKTLDHNARDLMQFVRLGEIGNGIPVELNRALVEHDHTIIIGAINFHYFAGFTGGRKLICPGLASSRTISETHKLAFDCETKNRRENVDTGILNGNAVHEAFIEAVEKLPPAFAINSFVNDAGFAIDLVCGDWKTSHEKACEIYSLKHTIEVSEKRDLVIVSGGGFPFDVNLIQAHKALDTASRICNANGTIIFLAECADGTGRKDFLDWFDFETSEKLAEKLCQSYQVNGQTAWNLLQIAENFDVRILTSIGENETELMRLKKLNSTEEIQKTIDKKSNGYVLPFGAKFFIKN
ncbi:nickel-dependent lactate racemase [soil metagenome]